MENYALTIEYENEIRLLKKEKKNNHRYLSENDVITFFFEPKTSTVDIFVGDDFQSQQFSQSLTDFPFRKPFSFSLPRKYLIEASRHRKSGIPLCLYIEKESDHYLVDVMYIDRLREYLADTTLAAHIELRNKLREMPFQTVKKSQLEKLLHEVNTHEPLNFVEHRHLENCFKIQRGESIEYYAIPSDVIFPISFTLNETALDHLKTATKLAKTDTVELLMHDNQFSFRSDNILLTYQLDGLDAFQQRQPQPLTTELSMVIDIFQFKEEIDDNDKYDEIRASNINYLLVHEQKLTICAYTDHSHHALEVQVHQINDADEAKLYLVDLSEIKKLRIKDLTTANQMKISVVKNDIGERNLAFYHARDPHHPYAMVKLEYLPSELPTMLSAKARLQAKPQKNEEQKEKVMKQQDMFGYDNL